MDSFFTLDEPAWLLLLVPLAAFAIHAQLTSYCSVSPARARIAFALRLAAWVALALALAGVRWVREHDEVALVVLVDRSSSMGPDGVRRADELAQAALSQMGPTDRAAVIGFAGAAHVERALQGPEAGIQANPAALADERDTTDVALALRVAQATLPPTARGRIALLSDGRANRGDTAGAALALRARGIELVAIPVAPPTTGEAMIESLDAPTQVRPGEPFALRVQLRSFVEGQAQVELFKDDVFVRSIPVVLRRGTQTVEAIETLDKEKIARYEAVLRPPAGDRHAANNRARAYTRVREVSRILIVEGTYDGAADGGEARYLAAALREAGLEVDVAASTPTAREALERYDAIVLSDVPAPRSEESQARLRDFVRYSGGGLVMIGGPDSFAMGGYSGTPIEAALPLSMDVSQSRYVASLAITIGIDSSGSMQARVEGRSKLALAAEGAVATLKLLRSNDYLGVYLVDTEAKEASR